MRKNILMIIILGLTLLLSACSAGMSAAEVGKVSEGILGLDYENAIPVETQLVFGTLMLEGTENEIEAETAGELLPLWKAVRSLSASDSASPEEIEALFGQIQETMRPAQIQAIADMQLTRKDMIDRAEGLGLEMFPGGGQFGDLTPEQQATREAARESGQMPEGGFGGGFGRGQGVPGMEPPDGSPFGQEGMNPEQLATLQAERDSRAGAGLGVPTVFLDAVIQYLEGKTG